LREGRYEEAEPLYERALEIFEKVVGPEHPHTTIGLNNLALLYHEQGATRKPNSSGSTIDTYRRLVASLNGFGRVADSF
jgi:Tetratricopeptide repeat